MLIDSDNDDHAEKNCKDKKESEIERERDEDANQVASWAKERAPSSTIYPDFLPNSLLERNNAFSQAKT